MVQPQPQQDEREGDVRVSVPLRLLVGRLSPIELLALAADDPDEEARPAWAVALAEEVQALREAQIKATRTVLTLDEAADYLRVSRRQVERLRARRQLRTTKLTPGRRGRVVVTRAELDRYLERKARTG